VRHLRETQPIPFVRMEVEPGAEAQVDFGQGAWVVVDGKRKRPHLFRVVLSHSRKGYSEVVWRQTTESFIRCLENSFATSAGFPEPWSSIIFGRRSRGRIGMIPNQPEGGSFAGTTAR
jgi:transposase